MLRGLKKMDQKDLFQRERKVLEEAKIILSETAATEKYWSDHYQKLLNEFERVVRQSQSLIRLGDMMQQKLNKLKEELELEIENHKKTQAEKEASLAQLFQAQKMEALGTLVGGIAHDFNNMLQVIIGYSDFLLSTKRKDDPDYDQLQAIIQAGKGGADLVKMLLAFGQRGQVFPVPLDLNHQINQLTTLVSRTLPHVIQIDLDLSNGPTTILADPNQIDQVVMNLAINASEAMPNGGRLKIATKTASLNDEYWTNHPGPKPGSYVILTIADSGRGMDKKAIAKAFDPFYSTKQRGATRGTGLGLSVVKGIVEQQGGQVTCESELGKGTRFTIYFPAIEATPTPRVAAATSWQSSGAETILVVEDTADVAELEWESLTKAGYTVVVAHTGREAIEIYQAKKDEISLVVLDLIMPEMSGRDCLMELFKIDPSVKVLIASGYSPNDELQKEIKPLVKGFLNKPFGIAQFLESVSSVLSDG